MVSITKWDIPKPAPTKFHTLNPRIPAFMVQYLWSQGFTYLPYVNALYNGDVFHDTNPLIMKDMRKSVDRIWQAIQEQKLICIYGDYDADGITGVATMYRGLKGLGANVIRYNPNRKYGYGASPETVQMLVGDNPTINLFVSVDNGIKATKAVTKAVELGIDFVVTDHHTPDLEDFPHDAYAVVNPMQDDCPYPNPYLSGVAVAYKVIHAMGLVAIEMGIDTDIILKADDALAYADISVQDVAIGIIADMMPLSPLENRRLVKKGMQEMRDNPSVGIEALATSEARGGYPIDLSKLRTEDIGFGLAPPLNATGRLTDPTVSVDLLLETNKAKAHQYAYRVIKVNDQRKQVQRDFYDQMMESLQDKVTTKEAMPIVIETITDCPKGIVGLIAGNLTQHFGSPSAVLARSGETDDGEVLWSASARSVVGFNVASALAECRQYLERFGGHAAAAGFSIRDSQIAPFRKAMGEIVKRELDAGDADHKASVDVEMSLAYVTMDIYDAVELLEPYGSAEFIKPKFLARELLPLEYKAWSQSKKHLQGKLADGKGNNIRFNGWGFAEWAKDMPDRVDVVYTLDIDSWGKSDSTYLRASMLAISPSESQKRFIDTTPDTLHRKKVAKPKRRL